MNGFMESERVLGSRIAAKDKEIAEALELPPIKIHCNILAEEAISKAIEH